MIDAVIFDKDGTLFDFRASWGAWTQNLIRDLAADQNHADVLGHVLGYDRASQQFRPDSPVIALTTDEIADIVSPFVPNLSHAALYARMNDLAAAAPMVPAVDLPVVLGGLRARGLILGLATNDTEAPARLHLKRAGVLGLFDFVAGCDSGFGGKPAPGQLQAFAQACGVAPVRVAMVGDSLHDLEAGRRAGMHAVAVLTGVATHADLAPHADVVLPDISQLAAWIDAIGSRQAAIDGKLQKTT